MKKNDEIAIKSLGFGTALPITISWSLNKSICWAIFHGLCSWGYVLYFAMFLSGE